MKGISQVIITLLALCIPIAIMGMIVQPATMIPLVGVTLLVTCGLIKIIESESPHSFVAPDQPIIADMPIAPQGAVNQEDRERDEWAAAFVAEYGNRPDFAEFAMKASWERAIAKNTPLPDNVIPLNDHRHSSL